MTGTGQIQGCFYVKEVTRLLALLAACYSINLLWHVKHTALFLSDLGVVAEISFAMACFLSASLLIFSLLHFFQKIPVWLLTLPLVFLSAIPSVILLSGLAVDCGCLAPTSLEYQAYSALPVNLFVSAFLLVAALIAAWGTRIRHLVRNKSGAEYVC